MRAFCDEKVHITKRDKGRNASREGGYKTSSTIEAEECKLKKKGSRD